MSYFVVNEITIKGSRCGPFEPALRMLAQKRIVLPEIELFDLKTTRRHLLTGIQGRIPVLRSRTETCREQNFCG